MELTRPLMAEELELIRLTRGLIASMAGLSLLVCCTRLHLRYFTIKIFGFDDWVCLVALVFTQSFNALSLVVSSNGSGMHIDALPPNQIETWLKLYYAAMCLYLYVGMTVRISLLVFYMRIFVKDWVRNLSYATMAFSVLFAVSGSFVLAFQCNPPRAAFTLSLQATAKCYTQYQLFQITLYQAVLMFATDLVILALPLPVLWGLNMPVKRKFAVSMVLVSGTLACIAPVVRFSTLDYLREGTTDLTFKSTSSLYWIAIEFNLGLVAGSMSTLRRLPGLRSLGSSNDRSGYKQDSLPLSGMKGRGEPRRKQEPKVLQYQNRNTSESQERIYPEGNLRDIKKETTFSVDEEYSHPSAMPPRGNGPQQFHRPW